MILKLTVLESHHWIRAGPSSLRLCQGGGGGLVCTIRAEKS